MTPIGVLMANYS